MGSVREPVQERSRETVDRIVGAAAEHFARDGFDRTTIRSIATSAEVPMGSIYQYFAGKDAVLDRLADDFERRIDDIVRAAMSGVDDDGAPTLESMVSAIIRGLVDTAADAPVFRAMFCAASTSGPFPEAGHRLRVRLAGHIASGLASVLPPSEYERAAVVCTEIVRGLLERIVDPGGAVDPSLQAHLERVLQLYIDDLKHRTD